MDIFWCMLILIRESHTCIHSVNGLLLCMELKLSLHQDVILEIIMKSYVQSGPQQLRKYCLPSGVDPTSEVHQFIKVP
jgi:hypothetical protein